MKLLSHAVYFHIPECLRFMQKKTKRTLIELSIILAVFGVLYTTNTLKDAVGFVQRLMVKTQLIRPGTEADTAGKTVNFQWDLLDEKGRKVSFRRFKGKTVFLNFWATWCPPCIAEMPNIDALYRRTNRSRVAFIMVAKDRNFSKAIRFKNKKNYQLPIYHMQSEAPSEFFHQSIPTTFIISPEGKIVSSETGLTYYNTDSFKNYLETL
ncbi:MAG: TlpA family protein disulfide reductase [Cytophagales bacterium]|nr:TlpA family protein disulfide reductase [Cytophagales bacterium]